MRKAVAVAVGVVGLVVLFWMLDHDGEHPSVRKAREEEEERQRNPIH